MFGNTSVDKWYWFASIISGIYLVPASEQLKVSSLLIKDVLIKNYFRCYIFKVIIWSTKYHVLFNAHLNAFLWAFQPQLANFLKFINKFYSFASINFAVLFWVSPFFLFLEKWFLVKHTLCPGIQYLMRTLVHTLPNWPQNNSWLLSSMF